VTIEPTGWREKDDRTIAEMRGYMEAERLDAFIPWKPPHLAYLLNYSDPVHTAILWDEMTAVLVVPKERDVFAVGTDSALSGSPDAGVRPWWFREHCGDFAADRGKGDPSGWRTIQGAAALMKERGLGKARIGVEQRWMPVEVHRRLAAALPDCELVAADGLVPSIRVVKTEREQALLRKAVEAGFRAMEAYMAAIRRGASVDEANLVRAQRCLEYGAEWSSGPNRIAWTGGTDATPAWWDAPARRQFPTSRRSRNYRGLPDDTPFVLTHFETRFQGYFSDAAWHEFIDGEPAIDEVLAWGDRQVTYREARRDWEIIRRVQRDALTTIKHGMNQWEALAAIDGYLAADGDAREVITGYWIHSLGLEVHEEPVINWGRGCIPGDSPVPFRLGTVVSSEWFTALWTVEDPFVLTETGWRPLAELKDIVDPAAATLDPRTLAR
jgi:Xaa-Pro aminopeptidase